MYLQARKNQRLFVTDRQAEILVGSLLGDAYITKRGQIQFEQSEKQKEYLFWKYDELSSIAYENISTVRRFDKRFNKEYMSYRFWTRQYFLPLRDKFYLDGKKIVPKDIQLSPLSLAVWYMDDGCFSDHKCILATDSFSQRDILFLQSLLSRRFQIMSSIRGGSKLLIRKESWNAFFSIIQPYILSAMHYKLLTL